MKRQREGNSTDEIEVTPEIEAGKEVLLAALGGAISSSWSLCGLAVSVHGPPGLVRARISDCVKY